MEEKIADCRNQRGHYLPGRPSAAGILHPFFGKHHSEETKAILSAQQLKNPVRYWLGKKRGPCSESTRKKMSASHPKGPLHPNWKGGITPLIQKIRRSYAYSLWRSSVFARDYRVCQICFKITNQKLVAHHLKSFSEFPELRFATDNGMTLHRGCHNKIHAAEIRLRDLIYGIA